MGRGTKVLSYLAVHVPAELLALRASANESGDGRVPDFVAPVIRDAEISTALHRLNDAVRGVHGPRAVPYIAAAGDGLGFDDVVADDALTTAIDLLVRRHGDSSPAAATSPREPILVRVVRDIIEDCYADRAQTSLRALAQRTGVTPFHLVRVFSRSMGLSPHRFVVQTRVRRARQLLASGVSPSYVAAMTGFVDQSHLTTQFKRYVGTTPVSYQRCFTTMSSGRRSASSR